ncbi:MAG: beta-CASP ribonuclease aCPSF1 [Candidatus Aenigmarchaeota archaeon]|nr:beta-CASP ribonuclease aCPSF1 [Candidatus Aenigmarchaeota archaeon]
MKHKTYWTPDIKRAPFIDSELIKTIRRMTHKEAGYRKKFLHNLGERIYGEKKGVEWIRATFLGAAREVGRSAILIQTPNSRVLLDCGIAPGSSKSFPYLEVPEFNIQTLDAVIISHAHMDHIGLVPLLFEYGYRGPIYMTRPTRDTGVLLQMDYIGICQREGKPVPYSSKGIEEMLKHCIVLEYDEVTDITPDVRITLSNAGHVLGSSTVHLHIGDGLYNILYTGDIKYENTKLFEKASTDFTRVEGLIIESTYGMRDLPPHGVGVAKVVEKIKEVIARGGKIIVPAFATGRAQEIIAILAESDIQAPIYLDGMIWDSTAIHTAYPEFFSRLMQNKILYKDKDPFQDPRLKAVGSGKERQKVFESDEPCVVLATAGMLIGGPAIEYLRNFANDEKNLLLFVSYQAEGTLGSKIQKGWKYVPTATDERGIELKLEIDTVEGLGGHCDREQLYAFISSLKTRPKKIIVNHGESMTCSALARALHKDFRIETNCPRALETIRFA